MQRYNADRILAIIALSMLAIGCVLVLWPFMTAVVWAAILASTSWPAFLWLDRKVGQRRLLTASLMTLLVTLILLGPVVAVAAVLTDNIDELSQAASALIKNGLPDAPSWMKDIPLLGPTLHDYWSKFAHNGERLIMELQKLAEPAQAMAIAGGRVVGRGVLDIALSVFLAFFFFLNGEVLANRLGVALRHLSGDRAAYLTSIARGTVTGVIYGIIGTGIAQGVLAAIGFAVAGVPGAVLLGVATFFLSVLPVGPPIVWIGATIWLLQQGDMGWAIFMAVWGFFGISMVDNVIKPFIISRGASLPFAIVFLGVLGGVLAFGVIGVFLGPALLAVGYRLTIEWTAVDNDPLSPQ